MAFIERRWKDLEAAVRRAIELQPSHVPSLGLLGMCLCLHQKPDEAEPFFERARLTDPLASFPYMLTALGLLTVRRPQEAHGYAEQALTFEKDDASALFCSSLANVAMGRFEEGIAAAEHGVSVSHRGADFLGLLGWALATAGRKDEARTLLEELRARPADAPPIVSEGWLLGALGEIDAAFEVLVRAEDEHQLWLYYTGLPGFDPLRADQRFDALLERLGLPPSPSRKLTDSAADPDSSPEKSIAVLPFVNMSADAENEYFSDGLSEEIINALTRIQGLRVIARTSAFRFRGEQDLRKVGEALGVGHVLEGSVRKAGQKLRITAQLIDVADDSHIWSERFDRELVDVFAIQDEISAAIVDKLHLSLGTGEPATRERTNVAALDALLEARHFFFQFTPTAAERALACIQRALSLEPDYPDALVLQVFYNVMMGYMFADPREVLPQAKSLAERALELDPHHGEAQAAVAIMAGWMDRDWSEGERHYRRALELAPGSARVHELYGLGSLLAMGRLEESLSELDRAVELDPLSALYAGNRGRVLTCSRRFAEAEATVPAGPRPRPGAAPGAGGTHLRPDLPAALRGSHCDRPEGDRAPRTRRRRPSTRWLCRSRWPASATRRGSSSMPLPNPAAAPIEARSRGPSCTRSAPRWTKRSNTSSEPSTNTNRSCGTSRSTRCSTPSAPIPAIRICSTDEPARREPTVIGTDPRPLPHHRQASAPAAWGRCGEPPTPSSGERSRSRCCRRRWRRTPNGSTVSVVKRRCWPPSITRAWSACTRWRRARAITS